MCIYVCVCVYLCMDAYVHTAFLVVQTVKNLAANAGDPVLIHGLRRSPGEGTPQEGAWWAQSMKL